MIYETNEQLFKEIKKLLMDNDITQRELAARLEISPQSLQNLLGKKQFCFADMKRILDCIGYELEYSFVKKGE